MIPLDKATLAEWVALRVDCERSGTRPGDNDLWIAATAISQGIPLLTCDKAQSELPGLDAIYLSPP